MGYFKRLAGTPARRTSNRRDGITWFDEKVLKEIAGLSETVRARAVERIAAHMRATTRFDDVTGNLRGSIDAFRSRYEGGGHIAGAFAPHAHLVEFGTKPRYQEKTGKFVGQQTPRPFVNDAVEANRPGILRDYKRTLER